MPNKVENQVLWAALARPLVAVLGLGIAVTCGLAAWQRAAPLTAPTLFPFAETWYAKSLASTNPNEGIADAQMAIRLAPIHAENWMLLAYQYRHADGAVTPRVVQAVRRSYAASPLAVDVSPYRLSFVFNAWQGLPEDVRDMAQDEARQFGATGTGINFLNQTVPTIADDRVRLEFAVIALVGHNQYNEMNLKLQKTQ